MTTNKSTYRQSKYIGQKLNRRTTLFIFIIQQPMQYPIVLMVCPIPIYNIQICKQKGIPQNRFDRYLLLEFNPIMWVNSKEEKPAKLIIGQIKICSHFFSLSTNQAYFFSLQPNDRLSQPTNAPTTTETPPR